MRRSMLKLHFLVAAVAVLPLVFAGPAALAANDPATVTAAVQVTANPAPIRAHSSPQIARNPTNGELVIVEADIRGDEACAVHISVDDGRTWLRGGDPMKKPATDCTLHADYGPYVATSFTNSGVLYIAFVASAPDERAKELVARSVFLARSEDGGRTFSTTTVFEAPPDDAYLRVNKGPMLAVDPSNGSRLYVGWRQGSLTGGTKKLQSVVSASTDGGRTFAKGVDLTDDRGGDYPALAVDSDGTLHAVYWTRTVPGPAPTEPPVRPIYYLRSTDQGRTFSDRVAIDPGNQNAQQAPLLIADPKSKSLYMAWYANAEQKNMAPGFKGDLDIFFLASNDGGRSWGKKLVLNDDKVGANQSLPGLAVAPNGRVDVAWYDFRSSQLGPDNGLQEIYHASSGDNGRSFGTNLRITDRSIDRSVGVWGNNIDSHHNVGLTSTSQAVYFAWQDSRNRDPLAQPEDVYMAKLDLDGPVPLSEPKGDSKLAWALGGAGVTAALMGLGLFVASTLSRSRQPTRSPTRSPA